MARIKVLELPTQVLGDLVDTPFVFIIDQAEGEADDLEPEVMKSFSENAGAKTTLVYAGTLDIDRE